MGVNLLYYRYLKFARVLAKSYSLSIKFDKTVPEFTACTSTTTIIIYSPSPTWDDVRMNTWLYVLQHEICHNRPEAREFAVSPEWRGEKDEIVRTLMNLLADNGHERISFGEYDGWDDILRKGRYEFISRAYVPQGNEDANDPANKFDALFAWDCWVRTEGWLSVEYPHAMSGQASKWYSLLQEHFPVSAIGELVIAEDIHKIAVEIKELLWSDKESTKDDDGTEGDGEPSDDDDSGTGDGDDGTGDSTDPSDEEGEGAGSEEGEDESPSGTPDRPESGEDSGDGEATSGEDEEAEKKLKEALVVADHAILNPDTYAEVDDKEYGRGRAPDPADHLLDDYIPASKEKVFWMGDRNAVTKYGIGGLTGGIHKITHHGSNLANHLKKLLLTISKKRYAFGKKKGKLSSRNVYRAGLPKEYGTLRQKIFKSTTESVVLDTSVALLVDCSGSMAGTKYKVACEAAVVMYEALAKIGINTEVSGFTQWMSDDVIHPIFQRYGERPAIPMLIERFTMFGERLADNLDGESVQACYHRLMEQKTAKKILIVFSDGMPQGDTRGGMDADTHLRMVTKAIEEEGIAQIIGIGINTSAVSYYYKDHVVVNNTADLETELIKVLDRKLI